MDSQRLIINNYDLSTTSLPTSTEIKSYTVVKAPKGPITPVRLFANEGTGATKQMQEIFGDWSTSYPELYEVAQYLSGGYDVYVSAPYQEATVPVAYLTTKGVLPATTPASYTSAVEGLVNGTKDPSEVSVAGITTFGSTVDVCYDVNYGHTLFKADKPDLGADVYPNFASNELIISTNATFSEVNSLKTGGDNRATLLVKNVLGKDYSFIVAKDSTTNQYTVKIGEVQVGLCYEAGTTTILTSDSAVFEVHIAGSDAQDTPLATSIVKNLANISNRVDIKSYWVAPVNASDIKATIFPKYPSERKTFISFVGFDKDNGRSSTSVNVRNNLALIAYDEGVGAYGKNGLSGEWDYNLALNLPSEEFVSQNILAIYVKDSFKSTDDLTTEIAGYPPVVLQGGTRVFEKYNKCSSTDLVVSGVDYYTLVNGVYTKVTPDPVVGSSAAEYYTKTDDIDLHNLGWEAALADEYSDVDIFFDSMRHDDHTAKASMTATRNVFFTIANTHTLSGYIFNYTIAPSQIKSFSGKLSYGYHYWNICNEAKIEDSTRGTIWSPMTGTRAKMQSNIIKNRWGGVAPMYLNSAGLGGQLQGMNGVKTLRYTYKKDDQMTLDSKNFNPVINDAVYGVMVVGQKTCKADDITDYSYIGHVSAFLNFEKEVKVDVMIPQLGKANNDYYRELRAQQVNTLLAKRLQGSTRIWAAAQVDTSTADGCNDIAAQKARKFVINVKVKVDVFSEYVELNFINLDQATVL